MKKISILLSSIFCIFLFIPTTSGQKIEPEMVFVEGGTFIMGSDDGDEDEKPKHEVKINNFYMSKYEITVDEYRNFCSATGRNFGEEESWSKANHPAIYVSWNIATEYCKWLSSETNKKYRLPTEAEWEYAAAGGKKSKGYKYSGNENIDQVAWYQGSIPEDGTQPVGSLDPNELGIYDMSGNVWEWCLDTYKSDYYSVSEKENPKGAKTGNWKIVRGGSWADKASYARITYRQSNLPGNAGFNDGFRIVREE
jgi:formylglycine-generating enzyme required for sulfatase activity